MFLEVIVQSGEADTLCAPEPRSTDSLGTQHCTNFESHSNRVTFETNAIMVIVKVHPLFQHIPLWNLIELTQGYSELFSKVLETNN